MKKFLVMLMVGTLCFGTMAGCGKSDEQKAMDKMAQYLREEAAADGVDLDKMVAQEMTDYETKRAENQAARDQLAANKEELAQKYNASLDELLSKYEASTDPAEIQSIAQEYNSLYRCMREEAEQFDYADYTGYNFIRRSDYLTRMAYFSTAQNVTSDTEMWVFYKNYYDVSDAGLDTNDPENYDSIMVLVEDDNLDISKVTIVKNGTEVMELIPSQFGIKPYEIDEVNDTSIALNVIDNGDFLKYVFDYSGSSISLVKDNSETHESIYLENAWANTWEPANLEGFHTLISNLD